MNARTVERHPSTTRTPAHTLQKTLVRVGALVGGMAVLAHVTMGDPMALSGGMAVFALALVGIVIAGRGGTAASAVAKRRYGTGIAGTMGLYAAALSAMQWHSVETSTVVVMAVAVMTPALVAARSISTLDA